MDFVIELPKRKLSTLPCYHKCIQCLSLIHSMYNQNKLLLQMIQRQFEVNFLQGISQELLVEVPLESVKK